jgi:hypothetical protein
VPQAKAERSGERDRADVERGGNRTVRVTRQHARWERNERDRQQIEEIPPEEPSVEPLDAAQHAVVADPVLADDQEAQRVGVDARR